jgi:hypothetical protein
MSEFLRDLAIATFGGLIAGLLSPAVIFVVRQRHRRGEEKRMLRAFITLSEGRLDSPILERKAANEAMLVDFRPVVERLCHKEEIRPFPGNPGYYLLTAEGKQKATQRPWWRLWG